MGKVVAKGVEPFLAALQKNRILSAQQVGRVKQAGQDDATKLARLLIQKGVLTRWQATQLLNGSTALTLNGYTLCDQIGKDELGRTFLAKKAKTQVALKTPAREVLQDADLVKRFIGDARKAAAIEHQNLLRVVDLGNEGERYYVAYEHCAAQDLATTISESGPMAPAEVARVIESLAAGLEQLHLQGMCHLCLNPGNLLIDDEGTAKIADVGFGVLAGANRAGLESSDFLAPEQTGEAKSDMRTDVYSLGCVMYFLLTGKAPSGIAITELRTDAPAGLVKVCNKMMAKDPDERFKSARGVVQIFAKWRGTKEAAALAEVDEPATEKTAPVVMAGEETVVDLGGGDAVDIQAVEVVSEVDMVEPVEKVEEVPEVQLVEDSADLPAEEPKSEQRMEKKSPKSTAPKPTGGGPVISLGGDAPAVDPGNAAQAFFGVQTKEKKGPPKRTKKGKASEATQVAAATVAAATESAGQDMAEVEMADVVPAKKSKKGKSKRDKKFELTKPMMIGGGIGGGVLLLLLIVGGVWAFSGDDETIVADASVTETAATDDTDEVEGGDPDASDPEAFDPEAFDPVAADPEAADPEAADPEAADPEAADPEAADPEAADPAESDPAASDSAGAETAGGPASANDTQAPGENQVAKVDPSAAKPAENKPEKNKPDKPVDKKPAQTKPKPPAKKLPVFVEFPDNIAMPAMTSVDPQPLGKVNLTSGGDFADALYVKLRGGDAAGKGVVFRLSNANDGLADNDWDIFAKSDSGETIIAKVSFKKDGDKKVYIHWTKEAAGAAMAANLKNCALVLNVGSDQQMMPMRSAETVAAMPITTGRSDPVRVKVDAAPDLEKLMFAVTKLDGPFPKFKIEPDVPVGVHNDGCEILIGEGDNQPLTFQIKTKLTAGNVELRLTSQLKAPNGKGGVKKVPFTKKSLDSIKKQVDAYVAGLNIQINRATQAKGNKKDQRLENAISAMTQQRTQAQSTATEIAGLEKILQAAEAGAGKIQFRIFYVADGSEIDLVKSQ